jgi:hypothetical protein
MAGLSRDKTSCLLFRTCSPFTAVLIIPNQPTSANGSQSGAGLRGVERGLFTIRANRPQSSPRPQLQFRKNPFLGLGMTKVGFHHHDLSRGEFSGTFTNPSWLTSPRECKFSCLHNTLPLLWLDCGQNRALIFRLLKFIKLFVARATLKRAATV